jgi:hypothetical protein
MILLFIFKARLVKDRLLKKKTEYETLQKGLIEAGRELHGAEYKIGAPQPVRKRVVQSTNLPLVNSQSENRPIVVRKISTLSIYIYKYLINFSGECH